MFNWDLYILRLSTIYFVCYYNLNNIILNLSLPLSSLLNFILYLFLFLFSFYPFLPNFHFNISLFFMLPLYLSNSHPRFPIPLSFCITIKQLNLIHMALYAESIIIKAWTSRKCPIEIFGWRLRTNKQRGQRMDKMINFANGAEHKFMDQKKIKGNCTGIEREDNRSLLKSDRCISQ